MIMIVVKSTGGKHHQKRYYKDRRRKGFRIRTGPGELGHEQERCRVDNISQGSEGRLFQRH